KTDSVEFLLQPFGWQPRLDCRQPDRICRGGAAEGELQRPAFVGLVLALRRCQYRVDGCEDASPIALERVERPGGGETLEHALVDRTRIDAAGEIGKVAERLFAARLDERLDRLAADALESGERVVDGAPYHIESDAGAVDRGRLDFDAEPFGFGAKLRELVGIAYIERHGGGKKLD